VSIAPATPSIDVFLSYKREDRARVQLILDGLRQAGLRVWWDLDIPGGARWRQTLIEHLDSARCVIVVWSEASASGAGEFVQEEAERAKTRHVLLPVRIDDVSAPLGYGQFQSLDLVNWTGGVDDPRFADVVVAVKAMLAGDPAPEPTAGDARVRVRLRGLDGLIAAIRDYAADLLDLASGPKRFLARRLATPRSTLEDALRFLALSFLVTSAMELPLARGNPVFEFLGDAAFVASYVMLYGCAVYVAWRLVGAAAPMLRFLTIHFYLSGVVKIIQTVFYVTARGLLRSDRVLYDEVMSSAYRGDLLWFQTNLARLSEHRAMRLFLAALLGGWLATLVWLLIGWGAYREVTGLTRGRSLLAFLIFLIVCIPVYILTTLISTALVS